MKTTDVLKRSVWVLTALFGLAIAACDEEKQPDVVDTGTPGPITVSSIISDPKVGVPGDTLSFTAVITSSSPNLGDFPTMEWSANGGTFLETGQQTVRWVAPNSSGVFIITAKATNDVNSSTGSSTLYVGTGGTLLTQNAGQIDLIGVGPDFHFLATANVAAGAETWQYIGGAATDALPFPDVFPTRFQVNTVYSANANLVAYAADTLAFGASERPSHIYVGNFNTQSFSRISLDTTRPGNDEHSQANHPSFSPNGQVVAYQKWAQSWDGVTTDSFHVYIHDIVADKRTLVTYEHPFPRGFFPTFSTDNNWLVYIVDTQRNGQWDIYGSPMTGNDVDGSLASLVRFTNTGGLITSGVPRELPRPPLAWNPVSSVLAVAAADDNLYLVTTNASGATETTVEGVTNAQEFAWSPDGSQLAVAFFITVEGDAFPRLSTVSPSGIATVRYTGPEGDGYRDLAFSPDGNWLLYRVTRGGGAWFSALDLTGAKLDQPVAVTAIDQAGLATSYRGSMSLRPSWATGNVLIYPSFGFSPNQTPGIFTRDLSGLVN